MPLRTAVRAPDAPPPSAWVLPSPANACCTGGELQPWTGTLCAPRPTLLAPAAQESLALRNNLLEKLVSMRALQDSSSGASVVQGAPAAWCAAQSPCDRHRVNCLVGKLDPPRTKGV